MNWIVGIDIGGSFTDLVAYNKETGELRFSKLLTTYPDMSIGVMDTIKDASLTIEDISNVVHGTTIVINTILEGKGDPVALITTKGFRDVIEIARGNRPDMYNLHYRKPRPIVPRKFRFEVTERIKSDGTIVKRLNPEEVKEILSRINKNNIKSIAVVYLHSYANPIHEEQTYEIIKKANPNLFVSISSKITREYREYERSMTTVLNAYVAPKVHDYILKLESFFKEKLLLLQSASGIISAKDAVETPIKLIESGPVAGAIGSALIGRLIGEENLISFDAGSTTTKSCLIYKGLTRFRTIYHIGGYTSGWPVLVPSLEISEVGIAGNSIIWVDEMGRIRIGPRSAGSMPGPACYGLGGLEPTVTDMEVLMQIIDPDYFLGGKIKLRKDLAEDAFKEIYKFSQLSKDETLEKLFQLTILSMSSSIRNISIEKGFDPRDFILVAYGGAGPIHASFIAKELGIRKILIPQKPAYFSAWGMLMAEIRYDYVRTKIAPLAEINVEFLENIFKEMAAEGEEKLRKLGIKDIQYVKYLDLRYSGQEHTLTITIPNGYSIDTIRKLFHEIHEKTYGYSLKDYEIELVNLRLAVIGISERPSLPKIPKGNEEPEAEALKGYREVFYENKGWIKVPIYVREKLLANNLIDGPAIIQEETSTTVLLEEDNAIIDEYGNIIINKK